MTTRPRSTSLDVSRKRRRLLQEPYDPTSELTLEAYLHRADQFRSTTDDEPLPYPCHIEPENSDIRDIVLNCRSSIESIMTDHGHSADFALDVVNATKPGYPGGCEPRRYVRISYKKGPEPLPFSPAMDDVVRYLGSCGIQLDVEIVDLDYCFRPSLFPIPPEHPAVDVYESFHADLVKFLNSTMQQSWRMLSLFMVGRTFQAKAPAVTVFVEPKLRKDWNSVHNSIRQIISTHNLEGIEIDINILPGFLSTDIAASTESIQLCTTGRDMMHEMHPNGHPILGASIGVLGEDGGGTLGGLVSARVHGKWIPCALTNYHVIRPATDAPPYITAQANRIGSSARFQDETNSTVVYFTPSDVRKTRKRLER
ncbi:hypothetical protein BDV25DRAFT_138622 [Aspergillus avenaceus]|uniref:Uncharacterized protein n=1 Tax=Aspergillus avenaceus TaxID=36643 RepID=A0A5N6U020_ASPAV|nr:hypothetical protein BDV25DRAFT_138622 [Aspergillus avenaceus]